MGVSLLQRIVARDGWETFYNRLSPEERRGLLFNWALWGRPEQLPPAGLWRFWLAQAGRGWGKTRAGAEFVKMKAKSQPGSHGALIAETPAQARDVMVGGESGLMACTAPADRPEYHPGRRLLVWPNGSTAHVYSAHNYEELRGPQYHWGWLDELGKWRYASDAFDQFNLGLRLGDHPQAMITTTPRPISVLRKLRKDPRCVISRGSTYDNAAHLAADFLADVRAKYEGTRLGRQELTGELLEDIPGALWKRGEIDKDRVTDPPYVLASNTGKPLLDKRGNPVPKLDRIAVGVDPSVADHDKPEDEEDEENDLCGIVVSGRVGTGVNARYYVLEDASLRGSPDEWARRVVACYQRWEADTIVAEVNNGGKLVEMAIRQVERRVKYQSVSASRGKLTRAEPISMMYEQHRVHHVGQFDELEDQMCTYVPGVQKSPDRMDALVWGMTWLADQGVDVDRARALMG